MIRKLRWKFIWISALSVFFVLAITIGAINLSNYLSVEDTAQTVLGQVLAEGPKPALQPGQPMEGGDVNLRQEHYFVVTFNQDGSIRETDTRQMFALTQQECQQLAQKAYAHEIEGGKYGSLRYALSSKNDGTTAVGFLDIKERLDGVQKFLLISSLVSIGAYAVFVGLIIVASKIAFRPSEEAYAKQKRFITNASHELKTPLTVISADLDLIEMESGHSEWGDSIRDQLSRLTDMTNQLVTLSRLEEEDPTKYPFSDFSIGEVAQRAADAFAPVFAREGITFSFEGNGSLTVHGNPGLIDQLIRIFLDNAAKYAGGENKNARFALCEGKKGKAVFCFSNTIDPSDQVDEKQIMDRFYRSPSNQKQGSGIGLSIAQEIVRLHNGKIIVTKEEGTLSFTVTLK
ncbi:MAG: HAMP domain-containing histidine kinase [Bacilli bacterium]|nr:HAMP domain-containing histidine kinase [Bacilli bacterium]